MDKLISEFLKLPMWARIFSIFILVCMIDGAHFAWGKHRFVAEFAEATLAVALYWGSAFSSFGLGIFAGIKITEKTKSSALGWVLGIAIFLIVGVASGLVIKEIPGVGWRYELMMESD